MNPSDENPLLYVFPVQSGGDGEGAAEQGAVPSGEDGMGCDCGDDRSAREAYVLSVS